MIESSIPVDTFSESLNYGPTTTCPHPDRWTCFDNQATECEVIDLVASFVTALQPDFVVETGTYLGFCAEAIGRSLLKNGHGRLVTIEYNEERSKIAAQRVSGLPVEVLTGSSLDYSPSEEIQFAWFDSELHLRMEEFSRYYSWIRKGTIVGFHDTRPEWPLRKAIQYDARLRPIFLPTPRGVCFAEVL